MEQKGGEGIAFYRTIKTSTSLGVRRFIFLVKSDENGFKLVMQGTGK